MWSDKYYYLNIYYDETLSRDFDTQTLVAFMKSLPELKEKEALMFGNAPDFPFTNILLLKAKGLNQWSDRDRNIEKTNLIAIVCTKDTVPNFEKHQSLFIKIATFMDWQLVDEHTDDDIENYVLWAPEK
ncbi:MAG: hypothetical protein J7604_16785 [Sporocytophaga sp.]|uniref:hypothetical protein n=1 Tax=Sporocytophaga sp. TaxID=2231183 RepID=UPI001B0C9B79|nr:hypothetical protein [Sporocytophaga sp.]MBO9701866.1 hypothetical protein [Sporocytophaga sp.]